MPRQYALIAAAAGAASAFVYASLLLGTPAAFILAYLAQLPLYAVGLWLGTGAGVIASGAGIVVAFLAGGFAFGVIFMLANTAPVLLVVRQALQWRTLPDGTVQWYPPGGLLMSLVGLATLLFAILVIAFASEPGGLEGTIETFLRDGLKRLSGPLGMDVSTIETFADQMARFFPGIIAVSWLTMSAVNGILAQGLLARFKRNWRPSPSMAEIDLPIWLSGLTAIFAIGAFLEGVGGFVSSNMLVLFAAAYSFAGLSVVHALVGKLQWRGAALGALYGAILVFGWPIAVLALIGLLEPYANLKARAAGAPPQV
jgi:hypothetical protein